MQAAMKWLEHPALQRRRAALRRLSRWFRYDRAVTRALDMTRGAPDGVLVEQIIRGWGDPELPSNDPFLWSCIDELARANGPVIQLGAGLTTLVLAIFAQRAGKQLCVLEHDRHWGNMVRMQLDEHGITSARVITAPLVHDGKRIGYGVDVERLPKGFALAICDGDSIVPSGYVGVLTRLLPRLAPGAVVIARNVRRESDVKNLVGWAKAHGASSFLRKADEPYVKLVLKKGGSEADYGVSHSLSAPAAAAPRSTALPRSATG